MKITLQFIQSAVSLMAMTITYLSLVYGDDNMLGLEWNIWAIIGFTVFWISLVSVIIRLQLQIRKFKSKEYEMELEVKKRQLTKYNGGDIP